MSKALKTQGKFSAVRLIENQLHRLTRAAVALSKAPPSILPALLCGLFDRGGDHPRQASLPLCVTPFGLLAESRGSE